MKMEHWSATRFTTWGLCPTTFAARYVWGTDPSEPSEGVLFGSAVHQAMEAYANGADPYASFRSVWRAMKEEYYLHDRLGLTGVGLDLIEQVVDAGWQGKAEYVFSLDTTAAWDAPTIGAIDLITIDREGEWVVRDLKTSMGDWGEDRVRKLRWQPVLYSWAVHDLYGIWPHFEYWVLGKMSRKLNVFRLDAEETLSWETTLQDRVAEIVERVRADDFTCHGQHGDCLECGEKWQHGHVCDMTSKTERVGTATRTWRAAHEG